MNKTVKLSKGNFNYLKENAEEAQLILKSLEKNR
jgi:hypothetical protein